MCLEKDDAESQAGQCHSNETRHSASPLYHHWSTNSIGGHPGHPHYTCLKNKMSKPSGAIRLSTRLIAL
eukprot:374343-Prymnesium_polylepis.1